MNMRRNRRKAAATTHRQRVTGAFTLVELIVVVVIIGVIAAIAVPRLSRGVWKAPSTATWADNVMLQRQIELYAQDHLGVYPAQSGDGVHAARTEAALLNQLRKFTDVDGVASEVRTTRFRFGPYLRTEFPTMLVGPKAGMDNVHLLSGYGALTYLSAVNAGWLYRPATGALIANYPGGREGVQAKAEIHGSEITTEALGN